jgi:hypothetical protein
VAGFPPGPNLAVGTDHERAGTDPDLLLLPQSAKVQVVLQHQPKQVPPGHLEGPGRDRRRRSLWRDLREYFGDRLPRDPQTLKPVPGQRQLPGQLGDRGFQFFHPNSGGRLSGFQRLDQ